jgi:prepilin peptidase CpaA
LLLVASWTDVTSYRIPNWVPLAVLGFFPPFTFLVGMPVSDALWHIAAFAAVLLGGITLFAFGKVGGGDAKLFAAVALWVGWGPPLFKLLVTVGICGGLLSILVLVLRSAPVSVFINGRGFNPLVLDPKVGAPYAIAIAAGWFFVVFLPLLSSM